VCNFYDGHSGLTTVLARTGFFVLYSVFKVRCKARRTSAEAPVAVALASPILVFQWSEAAY
jgi:hypothetical protein